MYRRLTEKRLMRVMANSYFIVKRRTRKRGDLVWNYFDVEEWQGEKRLRAFTAKLPATRTKQPKIGEMIANWCETNHANLPPEGGLAEVHFEPVERAGQSKSANAS